LSIMKSLVQLRAMLALAVIAFAGSATPVFAEIIYNVTNDLNNQNGWSLGGTITVSGPGTITDREGSAITAWDLTASKTGFESHRYSSGISGSVKEMQGSLNATSTTLSLRANSNLKFNSPDFTSFIEWENEKEFGPFVFQSQYVAGWNSEFLWYHVSNFLFSPIVEGAWTLGTVSAVPEIDPATGGSALSLIAGVLAMIEQRRRRAALVA